MSSLPKECTCAIEIRYGKTEDTGKGARPVRAKFNHFYFSKLRGKKAA